MQLSKSPQEIPCGLGTSYTFIYSFMDIYTSTDSIITSTFAALGVCPAVRWTAVTDSRETGSPCGVCVYTQQSSLLATLGCLESVSLFSSSAWGP